MKNDKAMTHNGTMTKEEWDKWIAELKKPQPPPDPFESIRDNPALQEALAEYAKEYMEDRG